MGSSIGLVGQVFLLVLCGGCVAPIRGLYPLPAGETARTVYVLHRGLHTGLILATADIPPGVWPQHKDVPEAQYLEVGWGDTDGYRFPLTTRIVLRALFHSRGSVLLLHGFNGSLTNEYQGIAKEIIAVRLSEPGLERLCAFIQH